MEGGNVRRCTYEPSADVFVIFGEGPNLCADYQINGGETLKRAQKPIQWARLLTFLGRS
jgi:hypothetical protein